MENLGFWEDSSSCLWAREVCAISNTPYVTVLFVAKGVFVTIKIASSICDTWFSNVGVSTHRRSHMEQIEFFSDSFFSLSILKSCLISIDFHKWVLEGNIDAVFTSNASQSLRIFRDTEHNSDSFKKVNINGKFFLSPGISPEIKNFLRGTSTFDGHSWLSEYSLTWLEVSSQFGHFLSIVKLINWSNIWLGII